MAAKSMFTIIIIVIATAIIFAIDPQEELMKTLIDASLKCSNKTGVTMADYIQLTSMKMPENNKTFCYLACTAKSLGLMTEDNKINVEKVMNALNIFKDDLTKLNIYEKIVKVLNLCMTEVPGRGANECEAAKAVLECVIKNGEKENIFQNLPKK